MSYHYTIPVGEAVEFHNISHRIISFLSSHPPWPYSRLAFLSDSSWWPFCQSLDYLMCHCILLWRLFDHAPSSKTHQDDCPWGSRRQVVQIKHFWVLFRHVIGHCFSLKNSPGLGMSLVLPSANQVRLSTLLSEMDKKACGTSQWSTCASFHQ